MTDEACIMSKLCKSINRLKKRIGESEKDEKYREEKIINEGKNKDVEKEKKIREEMIESESMKGETRKEKEKKEGKKKTMAEKTDR